MHWGRTKPKKRMRELRVRRQGTVIYNINVCSKVLEKIFRIIYSSILYTYLARESLTSTVRSEAQYSQQQSVPDLSVLTVAFLALKKNGFSEKDKFFPKKKNIFFYIPFFYATFQCGRYNVFIFFFSFCPQEVEKIALKSCS